MKKVIAVSAGQNTFKKGNNVLRQRIKYLNYGLLGLATILKEKLNVDISVFQADYFTAEELIRHIENVGIDIVAECECFLVSIPSFYSISWCQQFCELIKVRYNKRIIVGGRWVVDGNSEWVKQKLRYVDRIVEGFGEIKLSQLFGLKPGMIIPDGERNCFRWLNFELLDRYKEYQPCIEISRGCGSGCQFCADRNNRRVPNKSVDAVVREIQYIESLYDQFSIYFEAPHFIFEKDWTDEFCRIMSQGQRHFLWRCTTRVESVPLNRLSALRETGLKVLDIGLESASKQQLINMKKTPNPDRYLEFAEKILLECKKNDIWVKFNLLLYAGETYDTISETEKWLQDHKTLIKDVSVSSLVYYKNMHNISEILELGASLPKESSIDDLGYINLNLSPEIDSRTAQEFAVRIPRNIANQKDFYDIKSISYFSSRYTYDQFREDIRLCDKSDLPFQVEEY